MVVVEGVVVVGAKISSPETCWSFTCVGSTPKNPPRASLFGGGLGVVVFSSGLAMNGFLITIGGWVGVGVVGTVVVLAVGGCVFCVSVVEGDFEVGML